MMYSEREAQRQVGNEREALRYIVRCHTERGFPPTRREIAELLGYVSPSAAQHVIERLMEKGFIEVHPLVPRGIRVTEAGQRMIIETEKM